MLGALRIVTTLLPSCAAPDRNVDTKTIKCAYLSKAIWKEEKSNFMNQAKHIKKHLSTPLKRSKKLGLSKSHIHKQMCRFGGFCCGYFKGVLFNKQDITCAFDT